MKFKIYYESVADGIRLFVVYNIINDVCNCIIMMYSKLSSSPVIHHESAININRYNAYPILRDNSLLNLYLDAKEAVHNINNYINSIYIYKFNKVIIVLNDATNVCLYLNSSGLLVGIKQKTRKEGFVKLIDIPYFKNSTMEEQHKLIQLIFNKDTTNVALMMLSTKS